MVKNLTGRYSVTQFCYWTAICGGGSFATMFLLERGLPSGTVGLLLALAGLLSCLTQPLLASAADQAKKNALPAMLMGLAALCCACFAAQLIPGLPLLASGVLYAAAIWSGGAMPPLLNALSMAYDRTGYRINYGVGRGIGATATALSSLALGYMIAGLGANWMLIFLMTAWALFAAALAGYPRIEKPVAAGGAQHSLSIAQFAGQYRWYCASLAGVLFLGMYHVMTESYLITIMGALGGDSSNVGTALFISAMVTFPVICVFSHIRSRISDTNLLKIAALSFLLKSVCFYFAGSIGAIYAFQLLQITSYAFLEPTQVYYAKAKVRPGDMVKGQAFITAAYALGGSVGNFAGGQLAAHGVQALLTAGIAIAAAGTVILFLTVNRKDRAAE